MTKLVAPRTGAWIETNQSHYSGAASIEIGARIVRSPAVQGLPTQGRYLMFTVKDGGPGIAPEMLSRIFDPYFSTKGTGRGLGLGAAHMIVSRHQGVIRAESKPGMGAEFQVFLPAASRRADPAAQGKSAKKTAAAKRLAFDPKAKLVVSSGFSDDPVLAEHREHGFCAALPKPYTVPRLQRLFEELAAAPVS